MLPKLLPSNQSYHWEDNSTIGSVFYAYLREGERESLQRVWERETLVESFWACILKQFCSNVFDTSIITLRTWSLWYVCRLSSMVMCIGFAMGGWCSSLWKMVYYNVWPHQSKGLALWSCIFPFWCLLDVHVCGWWFINIYTLWAPRAILWFSIVHHEYLVCRCVVSNG